MALFINFLLITILIAFMMSPLSIHGAGVPSSLARRALHTVKKIGASANDGAIHRAILEELRGKIGGGRKKPLVSSRSYMNIAASNEEGLIKSLEYMEKIKDKNPSIIAVRPLADIYRESPIERPMEEILQVAQREDRTLVAVFDSGVDYNHPDLAYKIARPLQKDIEKIGPEKIRDSIELWKHRKDVKEYIDHYRNSGDGGKADLLENSLSEAEEVVHKTTIGWDFELDDPLPFDTFDPAHFFSLKGPGHGTPVAGVVSSTLHGTDDIAILPIASRMRRFDGEIFKEMVDFAYKRGARIINTSHGFECLDCVGNPKKMKEFIDSFLSVYETMEKYSDVLFVTAAGSKGVNLDAGNLDFPASFSTKLPNLVAVTAVDTNNVLNFDYGLKSVHIAANGIKVESLIKGGGQSFFSGTSFAAPQVSRVAAQIKHTNPKLSPTEIISIIGETATKVDDLADKLRFGGVLNEEAAIKRAKSI